MNTLFSLLKSAQAPRVLTTRTLIRILDEPEATAKRRIRRAADIGMLRPVREGLYLNDLAVPRVALAEAAAMIRSGAVVSLQTVLGDAGVLNNFTADVTALLPFGGANTSGGTVESKAGRFVFYLMSPSMLYAGDIADRLAKDVPYLRATPEKAVLDWISLAKAPNCRIAAVPGHDLDFELLDADRLDRLAAAMGLGDELERVRIQSAVAEDELNYGPSF